MDPLTLHCPFSFQNVESWWGGHVSPLASPVLFPLKKGWEFDGGGGRTTTTIPF